MKTTIFAIIAVSLLVAPFSSGQQKGKEPGAKQLKWRIQQLHRDNNEGIAVGDIDGDGKLDITSGEYWYQNPKFIKRKIRTILPFGKDYMQNNSRASL